MSLIGLLTVRTQPRSRGLPQRPGPQGQKLSDAKRFQVGDGHRASVHPGSQKAHDHLTDL